MELFRPDVFEGLAHEDAHQVLEAQCSYVLDRVVGNRLEEVGVLILDLDTRTSSRWLQLRQLLALRLETCHWKSLLEAGEDHLLKLMCPDYDAKRALFTESLFVDHFFAFRISRAIISECDQNFLLLAMWIFTRLSPTVKLDRDKFYRFADSPDAPGFIELLLRAFLDGRLEVVVRAHSLTILLKGAHASNRFSSLIQASPTLSGVRAYIVDVCESAASFPHLDSDTGDLLRAGLLFTIQVCTCDGHLAECVADARFVGACQ